jgi:hypothetical protein
MRYIPLRNFNPEEVIAMTKLFVTLFTLFTSASAALAANDLKCVSYDELEGWNGSTTHGRAILTAKVVSNTALKNVQIDGPYTTDKRDLQADENYNPRNPRYEGMNRFSVVEDAWCWYATLLPQDFAELPRNKKFTAYVQRVCEGNRVNTFGMFCSVK